MKKKTTTTVVCASCGKEFEKRNAEINRMSKRGIKQHSCSNACTAKLYGMKNIPESKRTKWTPETRPGGRIDGLSPFRAHLNSIRCHGKKKIVEVSLTLENLRDQWNIQKGICPYTGLQLINPGSITEYNNAGRLWNKASVDRIDPSKGYIPGNIEFVSMMANFAKNGWTKEQVIEFCIYVANNHRSD
jgi:hypothetical protein